MHLIPADEMMSSMFSRSVLRALIVSLPVIAFAHTGGVDEYGCHKESRTSLRHCHPERAKQTGKKPLYDREHPPKVGDEGVFYGPVVRIVDGDTFNAKVQGVVMKFRLQGVDAPEHDQPYGPKSTAQLRELIQGQNLVLVYFDVDPHGRIVVQAWVRNVDINAEMVRRGAAWFDSEYSRDQLLYLNETGARHQKAGLWALPSAERIEPWIWRKKKR